MMIQKINTRLRKSNNSGVFHDTKRDVATLTVVCIELINKVNELTDEINRLKGKS